LSDIFTNDGGKNEIFSLPNLQYKLLGRKEEMNILIPGGLFLYLGIHKFTAGMGHLFDQSNISM
jgi:hypothetical protein